MPELSEVQTTVNGLNKTVRGKKILDVQTSYDSPHYAGKDNIKDPSYFKRFKNGVVGEKIIRAERRAKNILIHLSGDKTILVHMKMTGHFVYDRPEYPHVRLTFMLEGGKTLALSDMRKFAKVTLLKTSSIDKSPHLSHLGPEPLEPSFTYEKFKEALLKKPKGKVKQVLLDQSLISGIGNIYSDEMLWRASVHPESRVEKIPAGVMREMYKTMKLVLKSGIDLGGDSMSDYRNIEGERGQFQEHHRAYRKTGTKCTKRGCKGEIERMIVGGRSAHFCNKHQTLFK